MNEDKNLKEDITQLKTVGNYAKMIDRDRQRVYQMIKEGKVKRIFIDGVSFIKLKKE